MTGFVPLVVHRKDNSILIQISSKVTRHSTHKLLPYTLQKEIYSAQGARSMEKEMLVSQPIRTHRD